MPAMVKIIVAVLSPGVASAFGTISKYPTEMTSLMDQTVDPCTDFFLYSCGTWYMKTPSNPTKVLPGHIRPPTRPSKPSLSKAIGVQLFVKLSVSPDDADVTRNILYADNTGLPFGQEYFHEPLWATVEKSYRQYLATIFTLACHAEVETAIDVVIKFERFNAGVELSKRRLQEAVTPRRLSLSDANASYPLGLGLPLQGFGFDVHKGCNTTTVLVDGPYYLDYLEEILNSAPVDVLKTIIEYKVLDFNAPFLSTPFVKAWFDFYVMTSIGELLGSYYLKEVWTDEIAARADSLVLKLKASFKTGLDSMGWLDDSTRANATTKLSKITHLLGGPKNPKTYPTLTFDPKAYILRKMRMHTATGRRTRSYFPPPFCSPRCIMPRRTRP
ncbi:hypothetical protein DYB26_010148 [Aphanomyces astaci]|uniref:Peptidase M13 N-terminal domain-containing protein n=1 Tax=Aphanomyces astaci TaxID=112090 RepID=A0A418G0H6_APHAT|nr:hypothetical protein DYB26_010148 [Aphanomyces astaci]